MALGKRRHRDIRKWKKQRRERGFSDQDIFEIDSWFLKIIPRMIEELVKLNTGVPTFLVERYLDDNHLNEFELTKEQHSKMLDECLKEWTFILLKMKNSFLEARKETCSYKNKYEDEYSKAFDDYLNKYGWNGSKIKNNPYIIRNSDGSEFYDILNNPYLMEKLDQYKDIYKLYYEEEKKIEQHINKARKEALEMFTKYFDDLWR